MEKTKASDLEYLLEALNHPKRSTRLESLRRLGLAGTELARAQAGTIRLKLLKIGARITCSVRRIVLHLSGGYPLKEVFAHVLWRLSGVSLTPT